MKKPPSPRDIAIEVVRRAAGPDGTKAYVVRLTDPPTPTERLQLLAARLERRPIAIMPHKCTGIEEWVARYSELK